MNPKQARLLNELLARVEVIEQHLGIRQVNPDDVPILEQDIRFDIYRSGLARREDPSSWPAVRLVHIPTGIVVTGQERSVLQSKVVAMETLQQKLNERAREQG